MSRFKQGDMVITDEGFEGVVISIDVTNDYFNPWYLIKLADGEESFVTEDCLCDPTTAFLAELQGLMRKYDVIISAEGDEARGHSVNINIGDVLVVYPMYELTPDNIFDYEK